MAVKFSELSKGQKRCVLGLLEANSRICGNNIERRDIVDAWTYLRQSGSKIGFPNWLLTKDFKNAKGFYKIPEPTKNDIEEYKNPPKRAKVKKEKVKKVKTVSDTRLAFIDKSLSEEDMDYYATLENYGIPF